jgi:uncharacterized protein (TIGR00661 family)
MKILYAIQGTGNGHISRAVQLDPYLKKYGEVDYFLSGSNIQLNTHLPIKYRSKGLSLFYKNTGGLDYLKMLQSFSFQIFKEAKNLPVEEYDVVINDFEFVTSLACRLKNVKSIHFGHQASFQSKKTPRSKTFNPIGNLILNSFVKADKYLGLHFKQFDKNVFNPIIKDEIVNAVPINDGHITVYLPQYSIQFLEPYFLAHSNFHFEIFTKEVTQITCKKNICYFPISNHVFTQSMIRCYGIITAGGFETPAEAMYLNKKVMSIPIINHFEQESNAEALRNLGIKVLEKIDEKFGSHFNHWVNEMNPIKLELQYSTEELVDILFQKALN